MSDKNWDADYPTHLTIPPENAIEIDAFLFRLVHKSNPDALDFLASFKDPSQKHLSKKPFFRNNPGFYATSFFDTRASIEELVEESPERFKGQMIAEGKVKPEHGKGKSSKKSSHVSIWFYDGVYPKGFKVI
ncbi:hypothetical protein [Vibrio sp. SG41-7]|uniref:hypothetical protein n=1 Tax=Vibrio sp. SG41-7 TaxID=2760973 RepID=UPI002175DD09|nr:hypothetical protein [Vibrio sp. SG41-7]